MGQIVRQLIGPGTPIRYGDQPMPDPEVYNELRRQGRIPRGSLPPRNGDMFDFELMNPEAPGMLTPGNIDITNRPVFMGVDGRPSTVRTVGIRFGDGPSYALPTIGPGGEDWSVDDAVAAFRKSGQHLGQFASDADASKYAQWLHDQQERMINYSNYWLRAKTPRTTFTLPPPATSAPQGFVDPYNDLWWTPEQGLVGRLTQG